MKKLKLIHLFVLVLFLFTACVKDGTTADSKLTYQFKAINLSASLKSDPSLSGAIVTSSAKGSINWASATVNVAQVEFNASHAGAVSTFNTKNIFINNALKDSLAGSVPLSSGVYENIKFTINLLKSTTNPPFVLKGSYVEESGTVIPVEVKLDLNTSYTLTYPRLEVSSGSYVAKVTVELNNLVKGLTASDFGQTVRSTGPNKDIIVSSTVNVALFNKLLERLQSCLSVSVTKS